MEIRFPNISSTKTVDTLKFLENFEGRVASLIVFKPLGYGICLELYSFFPIGLNKFTNLECLRSIFENIDSIILLYSAIRTHEDRCFDIMNNFHAKLVGPCAVIKRPHPICFFRLKDLLPFFFLLSKKWKKMRNHMFFKGLLKRWRFWN